MQDICIVGVGNLGGALAVALAKSGWTVDQFIVRDPRTARKIKRNNIPKVRISRLENLSDLSARLVIIAVDDPEISIVVRALLPLVSQGQIVLHTSGSQSSAALSELKAMGSATGSLHPLVSISNPFAPFQFRGSYFCVEGDPKAVTLARKIVRSLEGRPFKVDAKRKALYHAAAVTAAGHVTSLFESAVQMMELAGPDKRTSMRILRPLVRSAVLNLERQEPEHALTGTFSRLDLQTFRRHLASFDGVPDELVHLYLELGERSLELVQRRDGKSRRLQEFREAVSIAKQKYRC
jgi:predicted short-subunit dehydrogenase-like oxidoreductase (DUF2520 family)